MKYLVGAILFLSGMTLFGQATVESSDNQIYQAALKNVKWLEYLYEPGVKMEDDTLYISNEIQTLLKDNHLRNDFFPEEYAWEDAISLMQKMELKKAFWWMINLYPEDKQLVMKTILSYDALFKMDKALLGSFYTYALIDPEVSEIENAQAKMVRPDVLESKLANLKEMMEYVLYFRENKANSD